MSALVTNNDMHNDRRDTVRIYCDGWNHPQSDLGPAAQYVSVSIAEDKNGECVKAMSIRLTPETARALANDLLHSIALLEGK